MRTDGLVGAQGRGSGSWSAQGRPTVRVRLPVADGARVASLYREGEVLGREDGADEVELTVRLDRWQVERLRGEGVVVVEAAEGGLRRAFGA